MPSLHWNGKQRREPQPVSLTLDSLIYPDGIDDSQPDPSNRLYLGDNFALMSSLLEKFEGKIDLIYVDPPFFTNRKFPARIGRGEDSRKPAEWQLAEGYGDSWRDLDEYIQFLYERFSLMHRLLSPTGSLYLHLDWHADAYARLLLDEIFGPDRLLNEIIWTYHGPSPIRTAFNRKHDTILSYTKSETYTFNVDAVRIPYDPTTVKTFASSSKAGFGKVPNLERGKVPEDWWYFPVVARLHNERTGYPTQKPEALLARIIQASSNPGDLVADFFCGSGTTPLVAARHGRRFLASDATFRAIHTTRARLVREQTQPFAILTAGEWKSADEPAFRFQRDGQRVVLCSDARPVYWELDPDWDGQVFKSYAQALIPVRRGEVPVSLILPSTWGQICIRAVDAEGRLSQILLK
jgi:site-specific DNA-methyltransferase (adenine-specific)